jgi:hypothetical protein
MRDVLTSMNISGRRSRAVISVSVALAVSAIAGPGAPGALAHTGGSNCTAKLEKRGATWESSCVSPFQGFPVGVAGVYLADDPLLGPSPLDADVHVEIMALLADGTSRPLGVECLSDTVGAARCLEAYNPLAAPLTSPEAAPIQIVALKCNAHSHSVSPTAAKPSGAFACWSTDEARADLEADHWFSDNGFTSTTP